MTDQQFTALLGVLGTFGAALIGVIRWAVKWGVGRITKSLDDNTAAYREMIKAQKDQTAAFNVLSVKIDTVTQWVYDHTLHDDDAPEQRRRKHRSQARVLATRIPSGRDARNDNDDDDDEG
jgi:hypothetical protein